MEFSGYTGIEYKRTISINRIFSVHYFEYASNFSFEGESHDFWEFICVDNGEINITAGHDIVTLKTNDLYFHEPNEFHAVHANGVSAPNLVVVSFSCQDEIIHFFKHKKLQIDQRERDLLGKIVSEAKRCFNCRLDDPYLKSIPLKEADLIGAEQMIFLYLEEFLIRLLRRYLNPNALPYQSYSPDVTLTKQATDAQIFSSIVKYLKTNLHTQITVDQVCKAHSIGRSHLQKLFKRCCDLGIIEYFSYLKIQEAKALIRTETMNFTEISEKLGYSSIHYFSRQFKKIAGMTPTQYASSIKSISDQRNN